jgi:phage recombination protein Bet
MSEKSTKAVTKRQPDQTAGVTTARSVLTSMAARYHTDSNKLLDTLKNTAFKGATNEQLMALCIVADQYKLNPFTKEIYAFPDSKTGGIVPVVGIDGWLRIINDHPQFDGMEFEQDNESCTCRIYRKDRTHPTEATEYMEECRRATKPWESHPRRMLRHKSAIQCARIAFGFSLKDPDEAERIVEAQAAEERPAIMPPRVITVEAEDAASDAPDAPAADKADDPVGKLL